MRDAYALGEMKKCSPLVFRSTRDLLPAPMSVNSYLKSLCILDWIKLLFRRNLQRLIRGHLHPDSCGSKYEPLSYHVFHHRTYSKWDCIGEAR